ncbi:hypothetical protein PEC301653_05540 [Pectobacterium carotovorum subsp. carotovorum]|nr:hypothetical protein PEC301653_05540 [Pectobacterium carotovorum subsp. carotovorum]
MPQIFPISVNDINHKGWLITNRMTFGSLSQAINPAIFQ